MRLCSVNVKGKNLAGIGIDNSVILVRDINRILDIDIPDTLESLIKKERIEYLRRVTHNLVLSDFPRLSLSEVSFLTPIADFGKVWQADVSSEPQSGSLLQNHSGYILSIGKDFIFPKKMKNVYVQGGISIIIRKNCENVDKVDVQDVILGYTTFIKFTTQSNSGSKNQYLHWNFGPFIVTHDEVDFMDSLPVSTFVRGEDKFFVKDDIPISTIRKQTSLLSFKNTLSTGDMVLFFTSRGFKIENSGKVVCNVRGVGYLETTVA